MSLDQMLQARLQTRLQLARYRSRKIVSSPAAAKVCTSKRSLLCFCSNDYLGLADHPQVKQAMINALGRYGAGSGAAHLVCGHTTEHHALEEELAAFTGRPRALLFSTGYMANLGVISALADRHDTVFQDRLNHASLLDAGRLSDGTLKRYRHGDLVQLEYMLQQAGNGHKWIVTDGVFSMDGDIAPLSALADLAERYHAWLMVDDAHGFGYLGATGGGCVQQAGLGTAAVPILMGTLGKAFGTFGAFVAGSEALIESLIQFARTYVYTTATPPAVAAATRASLRIVQEESWRRTHLQALIAHFRNVAAATGLTVMPSDTPIQPLLIGDDSATLQAADWLADRGFWVSAIRPPTVPEGSARLRITLTANHDFEQIDQLLDALTRCPYLAHDPI